MQRGLPVALLLGSAPTASSATTQNGTRAGCPAMLPWLPLQARLDHLRDHDTVWGLSRPGSGRRCGRCRRWGGCFPPRHTCITCSWLTRCNPGAAARRALCLFRFLLLLLLLLWLLWLLLWVGLLRRRLRFLLLVRNNSNRGFVSRGWLAVTYIRTLSIRSLVSLCSGTSPLLLFRGRGAHPLSLSSRSVD